MPSRSAAPRVRRGVLAASHLLAAVAAVVALSGCAGDSGAVGKPADEAAQRRAEPEFPVEIETAAARSVEYAVTAVGSVDAFEHVQVVARVPGAVERVRFSEGDLVEQDQVLVEIEPDRYRIELDSARAAVDKAEAELSDARAGLGRREREPGLFPVEDVDTFRTRTRVAEANLAVQRAALARAELNLRDALTRAPVAGKIETRTVETGQYVQPGAVLASLVRREPLLLRFEVPETDAAALRQGMAAAFTVAGDERVWAAEVTHVAGSADAATRMVPVTARVRDPARGALRPGSFAQVRVPVGRSEGAPVVPQTAVRPSERGFLGFIVEDGVARERVLTLGLRTVDGRVEVRSGLAVGDRLVVRGAEALRDGARVRVEATR